MSVCIGIRTNINDFGDSKIDVLNSSPNGVAKKASRCNERGSTYGIVDTKSGFEKVEGCNGDKSKKVRDCTDGGSKEVKGCTDGGFEMVDLKR